MLHWTYRDFGPADDLEQGDILAPTFGLLELFRNVHPHFDDNKYLGFIVLTQTCDLARRDDDKCAARYINVAAIRSLGDVRHRLFSAVCPTLCDTVYTEKGRQKAFELLERILNQNEAKLGLFYLYPDSEIGIGDHAVAFLRVSVAFYSDHYSTMIEARRGRLEHEFQSRLGWLVGNLYSRVATKDWEKAAMSEIAKDFLESSDEDSPFWVSESVIKRLKREKIETTGWSREQFASYCSEKHPTPKDQAIERIAGIAEKSFSNLTEVQIRKFKVAMSNDPVLTSLFRV